MPLSRVLEEDAISDAESMRSTTTILDAATFTSSYSPPTVMSYCRYESALHLKSGHYSSRMAASKRDERILIAVSLLTTAFIAAELVCGYLRCRLFSGCNYLQLLLIEND